MDGLNAYAPILLLVSATLSLRRSALGEACKQQANYLLFLNPALRQLQIHAWSHVFVVASTNQNQSDLHLRLGRRT